MQNRRATTDLTAIAEDEGTVWADGQLARLSGDGRDAVGGWPGTLSEARARMGVRLGAQRPGLSREDGEELARVAYRAARRHWHTRALREPLA